MLLISVLRLWEWGSCCTHKKQHYSVFATVTILMLLNGSACAYLLVWFYFNTNSEVATYIDKRHTKRMPQTHPQAQNSSARNFQYLPVRLMLNTDKQRCKHTHTHTHRVATYTDKKHYQKDATQIHSENTFARNYQYLPIRPILWVQTRKCANTHTHTLPYLFHKSKTWPWVLSTCDACVHPYRSPCTTPTHLSHHKNLSWWPSGQASRVGDTGIDPSPLFPSPIPHPTTSPSWVTPLT